MSTRVHATRVPDPLPWLGSPPVLSGVDLRRGGLPAHVQTWPVRLTGCDQRRELPTDTVAGLQPGCPIWCHRHERYHYLADV